MLIYTHGCSPQQEVAQKEWLAFDFFVFGGDPFTSLQPSGILCPWQRVPRARRAKAKVGDCRLAARWARCVQTTLKPRTTRASPGPLKPGTRVHKNFYQLFGCSAWATCLLCGCSFCLGMLVAWWKKPCCKLLACWQLVNSSCFPWKSAPNGGHQKTRHP